MEAKRKSQKNSSFLLNSFTKSLTGFLRETGLHGLKFVGDSSLRIWERSFFFIAFLVAFVLTCQLISNIYGKWDSTPVIIGISPHATSILKVPFPAITICNMNQVQRSKVEHYQNGTSEKDLLKLLCSQDSFDTEDDTDSDATLQSNFLDDNNLEVSHFLTNQAQPCEQMLRHCKMNGVEYDCVHLFRRIITDEGLCCVFNFLPPEIVYKSNSQNAINLTSSVGIEPVSWDPESGYPSKLPKKYYPVTAVGTGITMGFSAVLDAQLSEYYCSSTNGPGFKILFHNPITLPNVKDEGLVVGVGYETNFRMEFSRSEATPAIRSISQADRQCVFKDEKTLLYHRVYSLLDCERECITMFLYKTCACIPHNFPRILGNATICSVKDTICINRAKHPDNRNETANCRKECLPSCFDLSYTADALYFPLAKRDFKIANKQVANINKTYLLDNIAVMNLYYRESAYYGTMKNVYIGFTEFLSNIGGVMGLFLGFSVISIAELFYFLILKPIAEFITWKRGEKSDRTRPNPIDVEQDVQQYNQNQSIWHPKELYPKGIPAKTIYLNKPSTRKFLIKGQPFKTSFK